MLTCTLQFTDCTAVQHNVHTMYFVSRSQFSITITQLLDTILSSQRLRALMHLQLQLQRDLLLQRRLVLLRELLLQIQAQPAAARPEVVHVVDARSLHLVQAQDIWVPVRLRVPEVVVMRTCCRLLL